MKRFAWIAPNLKWLINLGPQSGYQAEFLPLFMDTSAPRAPTAPPEQFKITGEPLFTRISYYRSRTYQRYTVPAGEYITFWYVGHIGPDAVSYYD